MPRFLQSDLQAAQRATQEATQRAEQAESRARAAEDAAAAAEAAAAAARAASAAPQAAAPAASQPRTAGPAAGATSSSAAVRAAVAAALAGGEPNNLGAGEPSLDSLLSPGGTTLRFSGPTVGYAEAAAASPPLPPSGPGTGSRVGSPPAGPAGASMIAAGASRAESISSEIEPADEQPAGAAAGVPRPPRASGAAVSPRDQLAVLQARRGLRGAPC